MNVNKLYRIYNSRSDDGGAYSPFWASFSPDRRLSSEKFKIKMGYWASTPAASFLEVFLRRGEGEIQHKTEANIDLIVQARFHIAEYDLGDNPLNVFSMDRATQDKVVRSAIYGNGDEKDEFVKQVFATGFDGIEYESNHSAGFPCYALFEKTIQMLQFRSVSDHGFATLPLSRAPSVLAEIVEDLSPIADVNFQMPN